MNTSQETTEDLFHLGIKALVCNERGEILLLQVNPDKLKGDGQYWDLPGGRVQKGQTIAETLEREVAEEIGIEGVKLGEQVGMTLSNIRIPIGDTGSVGLVLGVYACELPLNSVVTLSDEHVAYDWFSLKAAADALMVKYPEQFCELIAAL